MLISPYNNKIQFLFAKDDQTIGEYDINKLKNLINTLELKTKDYITIIDDKNHDIIFNDVGNIYNFLTNQH